MNEWALFGGVRLARGLAMGAGPAAAAIVLALLGAALLGAGPALAQASAAAPQGGAEPRELRVYFGTYTPARPAPGAVASKGIYVSRLTLADGKLSPPELAAEVTNPSFLAIHPTGKYLVAVGEGASVAGKKGGAITSFAIDPATGKLAQLSQQSTVGAGPCFVTIDATGKNALFANYGGGSVGVCPLDPATGKLAEASSFVQHEGKGADPRRQDKPHAHSINLDRANRFAFAADLGLDKILVYRFDADKGSLKPNDPPSASVAPGSGPRHFSFHPTGQWAYVINEMAMTVTAFSYDAEKGVLSEIQTVSTLPAGVQKVPAYSTAEVRVHPSGKFLYGSNRGHDTIAVFTIDPGGKLTPVEHVPAGGKTPRNFNIDPTGRYLVAAHQGSNTVTVFEIDPQSGKLTPAGSTIEVGAPVCVRFLEVR